MQNGMYAHAPHPAIGDCVPLLFADALIEQYGVPAPWPSCCAALAPLRSAQG